MNRLLAGLGSFLLLLAMPSVTRGAVAPSNLTDYSDPANWICRPGAETVCTTGLDADVVGPQGLIQALPFAPAANPAIDCFYVYPTVSEEKTTYSDLKQTPAVVNAVAVQAARLSSRCRVFAPVYHQVTEYGLDQMMNGGGNIDFKEPMRDLITAWIYYIQHDNDGRGVVLVGHSQGTILLQTLIASVIDGSPQQKLLVSAFLAGDPSLALPRGKTVGGTFAHVPVCTDKAETGCVYAWASFLKGDASRSHAFGRPLDNGMVSACVNPAAPSGGTGSLEYFHHKAEKAPASDPPWVETVNQFTGACREDATGNGFVVEVAPGPEHDSYVQRMKDAEIAAGWGLHIEDIALVQGNILDVLDAEIATWTAKKGP